MWWWRCENAPLIHLVIALRRQQRWLSLWKSCRETFVTRHEQKELLHIWVRLYVWWRLWPLLHIGFCDGLALCCVWVWNQTGCVLVCSSACMLKLMMFVCAWCCLCVYAAGVPFPCYSQTICKAGCWSQAEARGTAGAPPWLIKVAARTSSPPEWRQRPHNAQPVCYACLSLSVDLPRSSAGGVEVPRGRSGPKLITILWQNGSFVVVI